MASTQGGQRGNPGSKYEGDVSKDSVCGCEAQKDHPIRRSLADLWTFWTSWEQVLSVGYGYCDKEKSPEAGKKRRSRRGRTYQAIIPKQGFDVKHQSISTNVQS